MPLLLIATGIVAVLALILALVHIALLREDIECLRELHVAERAHRRIECDDLRNAIRRHEMTYHTPPPPELSQRLAPLDSRQYLPDVPG